MKLIAFILMLLFGAAASAQNSSSDTIPVWVVYLDSSRIFAAYPGVEMRMEVAAGWKVISKEVERYFDTEGIEFAPEVVLFSKRRKVITNPFRQ